MDKGYVQVYTGDGKGKTTAALGLGMRAVGRGLKVLLVQFLKGTPSGELESIKRLAPNFKCLRFGQTKKFVFQMNEQEKRDLAHKIQVELDSLEEYLLGSQWDVLILDEILGSIHTGLVPLERVLKIIDTKPDRMELVLTGRDLPQEIAQRADLITEMKAVKHYMDAGVMARIGIEM
jgi:cob(I)alamin adenosyltransferase